MSTPYPPPVARLLELGEEAVTTEWMDYRELGLGPEHVPDLVRMAAGAVLDDPEDESPVAWAPMHAWRALGQLRAAEAVEPLLDVAEAIGDEIFTEPELAVVFGMIGRAAIPPLARVLADDEESQALHVLAVSGLEEIATRDPSTREEVVPLLLARMEKWERNSEDVNAFLVDALTEMRVMEAAPLMEQAFAAGRVELLLRGDWEDVQEDLGLMEERRDRAAGPRFAGMPPILDRFEESDFGSAPAPRTRSPDARAKKARRKQQKESRTRTRRRMCGPRRPLPRLA
ncbi:MAG: PBS lyase [Gemmatimonadota bacterium]